MGRAFEVRKVAMAKTAAVKSKVYAKYGKEIFMAAKSNPDPATNDVLRRVIERAKKDQVPADVIKRAIEKAKGGTDENYYPKVYEGFGPEGSMVIIECLTDNDNRIIAEIRTAFKKTDSKLGVSGSVLHQFNNTCVFSMKGSEEEIFELLSENNIDITDIESDDEYVTVYANPADYGKVSDCLTKANYDLEVDEITYLPLSTVVIKDDYNKGSFKKLVEMLDAIDDVQNVCHNVVEE